MVDRSVIDALSVFGFLTPEERAAVAQVVESRPYLHGEALFRAGDARSTFFVILSGDVRITSEFYGQHETVVVYREQDFISLPALVTPESTHTNGAHVTSNSAHVLTVTRDALASVSGRHPRLMEHLLAAASATVEYRLHRANQKLFTFYSIGRILRSNQPLFVVAHELLAVAMTATNASRGLMLLREHAMDRVVVAAIIGFSDPENVRAWERAFEHDALAGTVFARGKSAIIQEMDRRWAGLPYASASMLLSPLVVGSRVVGMIIIADRKNNKPFLENSALLVEAIAQQLADASERGRLAGEQEAHQKLRRVYVGSYAEG